jgi:hypothetical protein
MHGAGALKVDTVSYPIHALNLAVNNNLNAFPGRRLLGIDNIDEQAREISGSYTIRFSGAISSAARLPQLLLRVGRRHGADNRLLGACPRL